jgi:hypothetical protein
MTTQDYESGTLDHRNQPRNPEWTGQQGREPLPLSGYAVLMGVYGAGVAGLFTWAERTGRTLDDISLGDLLILGMGSHKLARMASKDRIGTVLRQPFTEYQGTEGALPGEASECARRDKGQLRQAIGELLCCPYCTTTWAGAALFGAYLRNNKLGRTLGAFLFTISLAEIAQSTYHKVLSH